MGSSLLTGTVVVAAAVFAGAASLAPPVPSAESVDLALILAVDVSRSMNIDEQNAQRSGYVSAFRSQEIFESIAAGPRGRIAVAYVEWSGPSYQRTMVPWRVIASRTDAEALAAEIADLPLSPRSGTSLSAVLAFAGALFSASSVASERHVLDVSGDGPNNGGMPIQPARQALLARGATINGLAISLPRHGPDLTDGFGQGYIARYYKQCVIGGPGSFVIEVDAVTGFEEAIRHKLLLEIAGLQPQLVRAEYKAPNSQRIDCDVMYPSPGR